MRAVVVYESEFGATRLIAEAVAEGLGDHTSAEVVNVHDVGAVEFADTDLLVVGAPTHGRTLPTAASRASGAANASAAWRSHELEPEALVPGVREWLAGLRVAATRSVAFTTRAQMARLLSGSAVARIQRGLRDAGASELGAPEEFLIDKEGAPAAGELDRAREWGRALGAQLQEAYTSEAARR
jgi:flavodoxin-like protein